MPTVSGRYWPSIKSRPGSISLDACLGPSRESVNGYLVGMAVSGHEFGALWHLNSPRLDVLGDPHVRAKTWAYSTSMGHPLRWRPS